MLMIFINAEKNKITNSFLLVLLSMVFWTGGSLMMRLQIWPSYIFWYHMSFGGILLMLFSYHRFILAFLGQSDKTLSRIYFTVLFGIFLVNIPTGIVLKWPVITNLNGKAVMVYEQFSPFISVLVVISIIMILQMLQKILVVSSKNYTIRKQAFPIVIGILVLFSGHLAVMLPFFKGFPIDIVSGLMNAVLLMYALIKRKLFKLKMMASESVGYMFSVALSFGVFYSTYPILSYWIEFDSNLAAKYALPIYLVYFLVVLSLLFQLWKKVISEIFIKDQVNQNEILREFTLLVSKSLKLNDIFESTVSAIKNATSIKNMYIATYDHKSGDYIMRYSDHTLADLSFVIRKDNPIISWIQNHEGHISMDEFIHSVGYKSMWESEKLQLMKLGITYCTSLKDNDKLIGLILFSDKGRNNKLKDQDIIMISSISAVASIAINNAHTYEKAYLEARTDELTGALNRRHFFETIHNEFEKNKEGSLALVIINLDDFKLFNQLYGVKMGDQALKNITDIIKSSIGQQGMVARYSGKEFAVILPGYDVFSVKRLTESIRDQIALLSKSSNGSYQKTITISAGISIAPYGAKNVKELIENAEQAIYNVKRKGKNAIKVFETFIQNEVDQLEENDYASVYDEYKSTIYALTAAIDAKDHYTFNHSDNVASHAVALAKHLRLNEDIVENIRQAALLHDIGKISIPEKILNKPGKLTDSEYRIMQGHVEASIDIIKHLPSLDYVIPAVLGHHERYDGRGYPRRISGEDIPLTARILCISDAFDAMVSKRCYKKEIPVKDTLNILISEAGKQFDPQLVNAFVSLVENGTIFNEHAKDRNEHSVIRIPEKVNH
jgi:diguanylate cyclase (GGDEF)-like protein/putative nucleotidyltransferase with HDIG domain